MTYFCGFDVAKAKLDWSVVNEQGIEQASGVVVNEAVAIASILLTIGGAYPDAAVTCVVEATGIYHDELCETAYVLGIICLVFNPILTKQQIKASVRSKKTDKTDALMIARLGLRGEGRPYLPEPHKTTKRYARSAQKLSMFGSSFKLYKAHITSLLADDLTDEAAQLMDGVTEAIATARTQLYADLAISATGEIFGLLQTIPGIGPYVSASIVGEIQDMQRFRSAKAVTAFAGLDPKIRQSGKTFNSTGHLTKRGSSYLRRSIFIAASVAKRCDPKMKALYDKKRNEGKSYTVATCVMSRKLLAIVRAVWLSGKPYDANYYEETS
jgi:transposase